MLVNNNNNMITANFRRTIYRRANILLHNILIVSGQNIMVIRFSKRSAADTACVKPASGTRLK